MRNRQEIKIDITPNLDLSKISYQMGRLHGVLIGMAGAMSELAEAFRAFGGEIEKMDQCELLIALHPDIESYRKVIDESVVRVIKRFGTPFWVRLWLALRLWRSQSKEVHIITVDIERRQIVAGQAIWSGARMMVDPETGKAVLHDFKSDRTDLGQAKRDFKKGELVTGILGAPLGP